MPKTTTVSVQDLVIDLKNFRTVEQSDEIQAIQAMISIGADEFWALTESLLDDGYLPTENIIVLETDTTPRNLLVKEGNRRVAALKIIHGYLPITGFSIPDGISKKISGISTNWKSENKQVPCAIYPPTKAVIVDKIVTMTHGKSEKAGRHNWSTVARARHNRDHNKVPENALDLLEKFLLHAENLSKLQMKLWAGKYPLSVLMEAIGRLAPIFGAKNGADLSKTYPSINNKSALDDILRDIGVEIITFPTLRSQKEYWKNYLPTSEVPAPTAAPQSTGNETNLTSAPTSSNNNVAQPQSNSNPANQPLANSASSTAQPSTPKPKATAAVAINDPRAVKRILKKFAPKGNNRQKIVTLRDEATKLDLIDNPIAFCFLLRSMLEISAKAYCDDHKSNAGPSYMKQNGSYNTLEDVLRDITKHLTNNHKDLEKVKILHGAMTELAKKDNILSVTSMNQLVHNPTFSIVSSDIPTIFGNIFPLLEAMNS